MDKVKLKDFITAHHTEIDIDIAAITKEQLSQKELSKKLANISFNLRTILIAIANEIEDLKSK
ncbi:MAG: hypothetical protein ACYCXQ_00800 [Candidatus Humimicrobiaceae bacterium]